MVISVLRGQVLLHLQRFTCSNGDLYWSDFFSMQSLQFNDASHKHFVYVASRYENDVKAWLDKPARGPRGKIELLGPF